MEGVPVQYYILFICPCHTHLNYEITTGMFAISWSIYGMTHMKRLQGCGCGSGRQGIGRDWSGVVELFGPCLFMWLGVCSVSDSSSSLFN